MSHLVTKPNHGEPIGFINDDPDQPIFPTPNMQNYMDDITEKLNENLLGEMLVLHSYAVAALPPVPDADHPGLIYVSDEVGGAVPAFSDGTDWRRVTDRIIVS